MTFEANRIDVPPTTNSAWLQAFSEVLELSEVDLDLDTNFFQAGGHSLLIPLLLQRYEALMGWRPRASLVFKCPTPRQLEEASEEMRALATASAKPDTAGFCEST